ncbi:DivIVA domain-containing protein [Frondihabitans cladoniiphilus]|uniref:DivIVA domain-containing protein n=1 Tax=Frondihabitans cladoniiphilus TaxID=715785 RepID=A0ABP8VLI9_9MICO
MGRVSATFPKVTGSERGYDVQEVENFLKDARRAYSGDAGADPIDAASIRHMAFSMTKHGYSPQHVDSALERLEDAFAIRERDRALRASGDESWFSDAKSKAEAIVARLERPEGHRFDRVTFLSVGYHPRDVDRLVGRLKGYFSDGRALSIEEVRTSVFRQKRGGYREAQVDLVLDSVVDVMLAVR